MLESRVWTEKEIEKRIAELKEWLAAERDKPVEEMAGFFAERLSKYDSVHLGNWGEIYAHIADYFDDGLTRLLDIGCGTGLELKAMFERFPELKITGIDLSADMLGELRRKYPDQNIKLIQADYFQVPFEAESYDAALSFETLHHFQYDKKQRIYDKLFAALKPGGYYIECDYIACCPEEEALCLEQYHYRRQKDHIPDDVFIHIDIPLTLSHQIELIEKAGFQDVCVLYQNGNTMIIRAQAGRACTMR